MVRLSQTFGKKTDNEFLNGAYYRCFGDLEVARLLSRVQSLVIKNGYELENIIVEYTRNLHIKDLDDFLSIQIHEPGIRVALKKVIKASKTMQGAGIEPDFIVFERAGTSQNCYIIELKDGHEFDTKSSAREHENLRIFLSKNANALSTDFRCYCKICGFNASTAEEIKKGFKNKFPLEQIMTGQEFCDLLGLSYQEILDMRAEDRKENMETLVNELLDMPVINARLSERQ